MCATGLPHSSHLSLSFGAAERSVICFTACFVNTLLGRQNTTNACRSDISFQLHWPILKRCMIDTRDLPWATWSRNSQTREDAEDVTTLLPVV